MRSCLLQVLETSFQSRLFQLTASREVTIYTPQGVHIMDIRVVVEHNFVQLPTGHVQVGVSILHAVELIERISIDIVHSVSNYPNVDIICLRAKWRKQY